MKWNPQKIPIWKKKRRKILCESKCLSLLHRFFLTLGVLGFANASKMKLGSKVFRVMNASPKLVICIRYLSLWEKCVKSSEKTYKFTNLKNSFKSKKHKFISPYNFQKLQTTKTVKHFPWRSPPASRAWKTQCSMLWRSIDPTSVNW